MVEVKSNSTVSVFRVDTSQKKKSFNVTGTDGTLGFCNLTLPNSLIEDLWPETFTILVDGEEPLTMNNWTDGTYTYIQFSYLHSEHKVTIIPEFPSAIALLASMAFSAIAVVLTKKKHKNRDLPFKAPIF